ncbi:MAG TPA: hypothetical protein VIU86_16125 [Gaiellaceae bacterium]
MLRAALGRLAKLFLLAAGGSAVIALPLGLAFGAGVSRSVSLGWYAVGAFCTLGGFLVGNRGPARSVGGYAPFSFRGRMVRWASKEEQEESINFSAVLIVLGFALIVLGIAADTRYRLI